MAIRGTKPTPTALKRLAGNPGNRPLNDREPQPAAKAPTMPKHFNAEAKTAWKWLVKTLRSLRLLAESDVAIMALYCETWAQYVDIRKKVNEYGVIMVSPKTGMPFITPHLNVESSLKKQLLQYLTELGLSPSSRSRVHAAPETAGNDKSKFFKVVG